MELKLPASKDLSCIWKENFLGCKGFLIPGEQEFALGREMNMVLIIEKKMWGTLKMVPVWANIFGPPSQELPRGTFFRLLSCDRELEKKIKDNCRH